VAPNVLVSWGPMGFAESEPCRGCDTERDHMLDVLHTAIWQFRPEGDWTIILFKILSNPSNTGA